MHVEGGDPLNSTFRGRIGRFLQGAIHAWTAPPPAPQPPPQALTKDQVRAGLSATMDRMTELRAQASASGGQAPRVVFGAGWPVMLDPTLQIDQQQQSIWGSEEAQYGRVTTTYGITPQAWGTDSATNITLERVAEFHAETDQQGMLYRKADMDFGINRKDSQILASQRARTAPLYRTRLQFAPADTSALAQAVCAAVRKIVDRIPGFNAAEDNLLSGAAHGYAGLEVVYTEPAPLSVAVSPRRTVDVQNCKRISSLEWVHPRDFRWHPIRRSMVLDSGGGRYVDPFEQPDGTPTHKLIFYSTPGLGDPHQRGYDYAAAPLHLLKFQSVARWSVMLEFFGIATPYMVYDGEGYADNADISSALRFLGLLGRGKPALLSKKFGDGPGNECVKVTPTPTGIDARGQHAAIVGVINQELSKLIQAQTLAMEAGGSGSYALANTQADSKEEVQLLDATTEADVMTHQLVVFIVAMNAEPFAEAFGATPDQVRAVCPRAYRVVDRRIDPVARLGMFKMAKEMGWVIDDARCAEELNIPLLEGAEQPRTTGQDDDEAR